MTKCAIIGALTLVSMLTGCERTEPVIFSSRASPSGALIAANVLVDDNDDIGGEGHLTIHNVRTGETYDHGFPGSEPELFLRWIDDSHLEVWRDGESRDPTDVDTLGGVHIEHKSYVFPRDNQYLRTGLLIKIINVPGENVSASFHQNATEHGRSCVLSFQIPADQSYGTASAEITAGINACNRDRPCVGVETRFGLGHWHENGHQSVLTSATISNIPSYNRLPTGDDGTKIRGQFLDTNAEALAAVLKQPTIQIEYSRDFFEQVIKYNVPLTTSRRAINAFGGCVGNADFLWVSHTVQEHAAH